MDGPPAANVLSLEDEGRISQLVGFQTWRRGRRYATDGAVVEQSWDQTGTHGTGTVEGSGSAAYLVNVAVGRDGAGRITSLDTSCTCPVGWMCKHAVALLVAGSEDAEAGGEGARPPVRPETAGRRDLRLLAPLPPVPPPTAPVAPPDWERRLHDVLGPDRSDGPRSPAPGGLRPGRLGLQFELADRLPGRRGSARATLGVRLRPVTPSTAGNWVRSGVGWTQLEAFGHGPAVPGRTKAQVELLRELRALSHLGPAGRWQGWGDDAVWLESIPSRRLWDVLHHAGELGIPLLRAGRDPRPVEVGRDLLDAVTDVVRTESGGVQLTGRLRRSTTPTAASSDDLSSGGGTDDSGGAWVASPDPASLLVIGAPPHGLVWWHGTAPHGTTPDLHLVALAHTPDAATVDLLLGRPITVPPADVARFERDVIPRLRRRIAIESSDASVALPDAPEEGVLLDVTYRPGPVVELRWSLPQPDDDEDGAERADDDAVRVAARLPALVRPTAWGARLVPVVVLEAMAAVAFVDEVLPDLVACPSVSVEEHGARPTFTHVTEAPVIRLHGEEGDQGGDWLDLAVEVTVGGEVVPYRELFTALAEDKDHMLLPSGTWFALDSPELRRLAELIAEARALNDAPPGRARLSRYQASLFEDLADIAEVPADLAASGWRQAVEALVGDVAEVEVPAGLDAKLRPYQLEGFRWLAARHELGLGGILADDMGLGKTLQALALILHTRRAGQQGGDDPLPPWLVVAPTSVVGGWLGEARRFAPDLRTVAITQTRAKAGVDLASTAAGADLVLTSYTLFRIDHESYAGVTWAGALFDEAQFLKNPASHANQRARRLAAPWKLAMTGTPMENSLKELWALLAVTSPGLLPRSDRFDQSYRTPVERHGDVERLDLLRRRIRPVMLRRTKSQVAADLPDKTEQVLELQLHPRHRAAYDTHLHRERQKLLGIIDDVGAHRFEVLRSLTLLRQAALDITLVDPDRTGIPSTKLDALVELLAESAAEGHRALVFSQFTRYLGLARQRIEEAGMACCYLDGSTRNRPEVIRRFREGDAPVFLISLKAGGFGLNLTEADLCVLLDPWWNPATEAQAVDRAHRIGQQRKVLVYRMVSKGTIEDKVMALKQRKAALFSSVVDSGGFEPGALSAEDVRALLD